MDPVEHLALAKLIPGEDESWLAPGWLRGSEISSSVRVSVVDWLVQVDIINNVNPKVYIFCTLDSTLLEPK